MRTKRGFAALNLAELVAGIATTMLGPLMPQFQSQWQLSDGAAGLLFGAQFLASVGTAALVRPLAARWGYFTLAPAGLVLIAIGVALCASGLWPAAIAGVLLYGSGFGVAVPAVNLGAGSAREIVLLNLSWCLGAVLAPQLIVILGSLFLPMLAAAVAIIAALVGLACGRGPKPEGLKAGTPVSSAGWIAGALLFLYVGTENSVAGWLSTYASRNTATEALWAVLPSLFWGGMLLGRGSASAVLARIRPARLVPAGLLCALAASGLLILGQSAFALVMAAAFLGIGFSPVFPLVVAQYGERSASPSGLVFSAGGLGGSVIPPCIGWLSTVSGSLRWSMTLVLPLLLAILWLQTRLARIALR